MRLRLSEYSSKEITDGGVAKIVITADAGFDLNTLSDTDENIPELIKESIRLIVDETKPAVLTSSMQKANIDSAAINAADNKKFDIVFAKALFKKGWANTDKFTIEVDFGETNNMIFASLTWKGDVF